MELNIAFAALGGLVIIYTIWRSRKLEGYSHILTSIELIYDVSNIDLSGETKYINCISHRWVIDSVVRKKHGRIGTKFQEQLYDNTLGAALLLGYILGVAAVILTLVFVRSIEVVGMSLVVFFFGFFILLGPGSARVSEELLEELSEHPIEELCKEDYSYAKIAHSTIRRWLMISGILGIVIVLVAPFAEMLPSNFALAIAVFTEYVIWNPALFLSEIWFPLALIYMAAILPAFFLLIWKAVSNFREADEGSESHFRW